MATLFDCTPNGVFTTATFTPTIRGLMNTAKWSTVIVPTNAFSSYSGYTALIANGAGGLWIVNSQVELYKLEDSGAVAVVTSGTLTASAGASITVTVDPVARTLSIAGATSGNGTFSWAAGTTTIFDTGSVGVGRFTDGSYVFAGTVNDVQDFPPAGVAGDAAVTLGALTAGGAGTIDVSGAGAIALGALTVLGEDAPGPTTGAAAITLGALTSAAAGSIEIVGAAGVTLGALSAVGAGPAAFSVGASTVKQRSNAFGPSSGTFTTDAVSTTTGSILVAFVARGSWSNAANPKGPTDSQGNTWTAVPPGDQNYAGYPNSRFGLWWCVNLGGSASHTFSATWGEYEGGGAGDEVTVGVVELIGPAMLDSSTQVERTSAATISGSAVTPTGPSITFAMVAGNGPTGQTHAYTLTAGSVAAGWAAVPGGAATGDPFPGVGYIQTWPAVLIDEGGSKTGSAQNLAVSGTSNEGGQIIQAVFQVAAGKLGVGAVTLAAMTATGDGNFPVLGDAAIALGSIAASSAGAIDVSGVAAVTLGELAASSAAAVDISGTASIQLGSLAALGDGIVTQPSTTGDAAIVLGALVAVGSDVPGAVGDAAIALGSLVAVGTDLAGAFGDASITLGSLSVGGVGFYPLVGDGAIQLGALVVAGGELLPAVLVGVSTASAVVEPAEASATVLPIAP